MKLNNVIIGAAITMSLGGAANAALVHAGGNVTLVSATNWGTGFGSATEVGASDGNITSTPNGQVFTNDPGGYPSDYFANAPTIVMDMDLGSVMTYDSIAFWNRGAVNLNSTQTFSAVFSTDNIFGNGDDVSGGTHNAANIGGAQQDFSISQATGRYVRISISDNYYTPPGTAGGDRVAFTEFQFNVVPEPSSVALLGIGGLALTLRRRK